MKTLNYLAIGAVLLATGCANNDGPAERAGARIDEMVDNVEEGRPLLQESGPAERMGRSMDNGIDRAGEAVEDAGEKMQD